MPSLCILSGSIWYRLSHYKPRKNMYLKLCGLFMVHHVSPSSQEGRMGLNCPHPPYLLQYFILDLHLIKPCYISLLWPCLSQWIFHGHSHEQRKGKTWLPFPSLILLPECHAMHGVPSTIGLRAGPGGSRKVEYASYPQGGGSAQVNREQTYHESHPSSITQDLYPRVKIFPALPSNLSSS